MLTSLHLLAFLVSLLCFVPIAVNMMLARLPNNPKFTDLALVKDLLRKRADIIKGKPVYVFSKSDRRIARDSIILPEHTNAFGL